MGESLVTWVYAVVPQGHPAPPGGAEPGVMRPAAAYLPAGVAGEPVRVVSQEGLCAAVGSVAAADVDEEAMRRNLADAAWVERTVRRHHEVVARLFQAAPTVPFRLGTVYHDDQRVRDMLARRREELTETLSLIAGRSEWGVQLLTGQGTPAGDVDVAPDPNRGRSSSAVGDGAPGPRGPGTSYLLRRKAERLARDEARQTTGEVALAIHSALDRLADASHQSPPSRLPAGQRGQMVLNACYLVHDQRRDEFTAATRELAEQQPALRVRVTGPWPAYSFVELGKEEQP